VCIDPEKGNVVAAEGGPIALKENNKKVFVIGTGRFGTAAAQGLRESFIEVEKGARLPTQVVHVSATKFTSLDTAAMAEQLRGSNFVVCCGTKLPKHATKLTHAMKEARDESSEMEFIDFSNPGKFDCKQSMEHCGCSLSSGPLRIVIPCCNVFSTLISNPIFPSRYTRAHVLLEYGSRLFMWWLLVPRDGTPFSALTTTTAR
jgi:hypothetical protein